MPLPIAHSMAGYAIAEATNFRLANNKWLNVSIFMALANLPDIDFLPGFLLGEPNRYHHQETHSIGFALAAGLCGALILWWWHRRKMARQDVAETQNSFGTYFLIVAGAVFSHCVLDLFTLDSWPPHGMPLLWPLLERYFDVRWDVFLSVRKSDDSATFFSTLWQWFNFKIALREFLIMAPLVGLIQLIRRLPGLLIRRRPVDIKNTQVARLGLLEISSLPPEQANRRSLTSLVEAAEQDDSER
jgi:inner membrane protein